MSNFNVLDRTIYLTRHGSHAYGLATPTSDLDLKGVCIPPKEYFMGYLNNFEQSEKLANKGHPHDEVIYSLKKFVKLAADCNPNIIEVLFSSDEDHIKIDESFGRVLLTNRDDFISKKARHTFSGYSHAQLKRIQRHRKWLLDPPKAPPTREEMGIPERSVIPTSQIDAALAMVAKKLEEWNLDEMVDLTPDQRIMFQNILTEITAELMMTSDNIWVSAARTVGLDDNFIVILDKERHYKGAKVEWDQYQNWVKTRNPARAALEAKFGYDTKHGSHLIRLMRMCQEILEGKGVIVKRPDREELLAIKMYGTLPYDDLIIEAKRIDDVCHVLYKTSSLVHAPDRNKLDKMVIDLTEEYLKLHG